MKRNVVTRFASRFLVSVSLVGGFIFLPHNYAWSAPETRMTKALDAAPGQVVRSDLTASHAVVEWRGDPTATIELRTTSRSGKQSAFQTVRLEESGEAAPDAVRKSGLLIVDDAEQFETRVVAGSARDLKVYAIDTKYGPRHLVATPSTPPAHADYGQTPAPGVTSRSAWGANESIRRGPTEYAEVSRIIVHHAATPNDDPDPAATVRGIYQFHVQGNGWNDIGYNFVIDRNGRIYEGRYARSYLPGETPTGADANGRGVIGAHAMNANAGSVGISLLGTYSSVAPTQAQQDSLKRLIAWQADLHNVDLNNGGSVIGHRDVYQTSCPGDVAYSMIPGWRVGSAEIKGRYTIPASIPGNVPGSTSGYWIASSRGSVTTFGDAKSYGSMAGQALNSPMTGIIRTADAKGYWLLGADGGIFSFGNARFYGSMGGLPLNAPVVDLAPTPSGNGYWLVASDGGIFAYGDAGYYGSMGGKHLNKPIVGMSPTTSGNGYWLVASDGGVFAYGDAGFYGSMGGKSLNRPVSGMTRPSANDGYWLFADDGGVFTFGGIQFYGSIPGIAVSAYGGTAQVIVTSSSRGYYVLSRSGAVYSFGDARFHGAGVAGGGQAVGIATTL